MYSVKCKTCSDENVSETFRSLRARTKGHCEAIRLGQSSKSAIAEHVQEQSMPHEIDWQGMIVHAGRGSEKSEKHFTFKSANRNPIVTAVLNEALFGMPSFDFGVGLDSIYGEIVFGFCVLVVIGGLLLTTPL